MTWTYEEFMVLKNSMRRALNVYFISSGIHCKMMSEQKHKGQEDFVWEIVVELRKFCTLDGTLVKPNLTVSDIDPIEGLNYNIDYETSRYYNRYPEVFPRFLYNRHDLRDAKENGVGTRFKATLGRFRLSLTNNGTVKVEHIAPPRFHSGGHDPYISMIRILRAELPECEDVIKLIQAHFTHPCLKAQKRAQLIKRELCETVMKKDFMKETQKIKASRSLNDYFMLFQNLDEPY